jgi:hypothetical protein
MVGNFVFFEHSSCVWNSAVMFVSTHLDGIVACHCNCGTCLRLHSSLSLKHTYRPHFRSLLAERSPPRPTIEYSAYNRNKFSRALIFFRYTVRRMKSAKNNKLNLLRERRAIVFCPVWNWTCCSRMCSQWWMGLCSSIRLALIKTFVVGTLHHPHYRCLG